MLFICRSQVYKVSLSTNEKKNEAQDGQTACLQHSSDRIQVFWAPAQFCFYKTNWFLKPQKENLKDKYEWTFT